MEKFIVRTKDGKFSREFNNFDSASCFITYGDYNRSTKKWEIPKIRGEWEMVHKDSGEIHNVNYAFAGEYTSNELEDSWGCMYPD